MKKASYFYLVLTILFVLLGCCMPEESQPQPEPQKKYSYTVNITNAVDFPECTFEYIFYVDGKEDGRTETAISKRPEFILISTEVDGYRHETHYPVEAAFDAFDDTFLVDYIRVFDIVK